MSPDSHPTYKQKPGLPTRFHPPNASMSFLPDLASWALGGGAGGNNADDEQGNSLGGGGGSTNAEAEAQQQQQQQQTTDEIRAKRLAKMMGGQQQQEKAGQEDVEMADAAAATVSATAAARAEPMTVDKKLSSSPKGEDNTSTGTSMNMEIDEPMTKRTKSSPAGGINTASAATTTATTTATKVKSPKAKARPLHRKKELLLRRTLSISLASSTASAEDRSCATIDAGLDGTAAVAVSSIAEILAARLSLPKSSPVLTGTVPPQKVGTVAYLGHCYVKASEELKTIRQGRERREQKAKSKSGTANTNASTNNADVLNAHDDELTALTTEIQAQVVSYAASTLLEPDLFEQGGDGAGQVCAALQAAAVDPAHAITLNVAGTGTSFYARVCDELRGQDDGAYRRIIGEVVTRLSDALDGCETVTDGGGGGVGIGGGGGGGSGIGGGGPLVLVNALTALCQGYKPSAAVVASHPTFLLPPPNTPQAAERVTPPQPQVPTGANAQQAQLYRLMAAMTQGARRGYARRSGPALERHTVLGRAMRMGVPADDPNAVAAFANMGTRSKKDSDHATGGLRSQLGVYQTALNALVKVRLAYCFSSPTCMDVVAAFNLCNVVGDFALPDRLLCILYFLHFYILFVVAHHSWTRA